MLEDHPELLATLNDDAFGGPQDIEHYFGWVGSRLARWELDEENTAVVSNPGDLEAIIELFAIFTRKRILAEPEESDSEESVQHGIDQETA